MSKCRSCENTTKDPNQKFFFFHPDLDEKYMFVNNDCTLCAQCAINNKTLFNNRITGKNAFIIYAQVNQYVPGGQFLKINYNNEQVIQMSKADFIRNYVEETK